MAWGGAVGRVVTADSAYSKVLLLTDPSSGVAGLLQHSRAQGIVFGTEGPGLEMRFVPRFSDVSHGDRVVTSGLAGIFPRGIGVGRVTSIRQAADGTQTIELAPELDYGSLEEVLIVLETAEGGSLPHPAAEGAN
jgi:rod shape-determining protein MreC